MHIRTFAEYVLQFIPARIYKFKVQNYEIYKHALTRKHGLEVGGPSGIFKKRNILPVYPIVKSIDGCNFSSHTVWEGRIDKMTYLEHDTECGGKQYISDATDLSIIESQLYDFVLSSHCLEHVANPLKALYEWTRVLKNDGFLLLVLPHKDKTFDHKRPVTTIDHVISDYDKCVGEDDLSHLEEILALHDLSMDKRAGDYESFRARSQQNKFNRCLHHHVFDADLVVSLMNHIKMKIVSLDFAFPYHIVCLAQKNEKDALLYNSQYIGKNAIFRKDSIFPSDKIRIAARPLVLCYE